MLPASRLVVIGVAALLAYAGSAPAVAAPDAAGRGARLFNGGEAMAARLAGHSATLPAALGACMNCHGVREGSPLEARAAPVLNCATLRVPRPRRGGPLVAYDLDRFCRTLRTGIDPNYIVLSRTMPIFEPDRAQCAALWAYLGGAEETCHEQQ
jgi:hypothetical protein